MTWTQGRKEIGKKQDKQQQRNGNCILYCFIRRCKCSTTFLINAFFEALVLGKLQGYLVVTLYNFRKIIL